MPLAQLAVVVSLSVVASVVAAAVVVVVGGGRLAVVGMPVDVVVGLVAGVEPEVVLKEAPRL